MAQSLNMNEYVAPLHWSIENFEFCRGLDPKAEFELIAPVMIYFEADSRWADKARAALKKLRAAKHPLFADLEQSVEAIMKMRQTPDQIINRYNALVMWLADEVRPEIVSYIDKWGAYAFTVGQDATVLAGDASGTFAFFDSFSHLEKRIQDAVDAMEESFA